MQEKTKILKIDELTTNISYLEANMKAKAINKTLMGDDPRFNYRLQLVFNNGTTIFYHDTFALKCDEWLFVFKRDDYSIYNFEKLEHYGQYKLLGIEII